MRSCSPHPDLSLAPAEEPREASIPPPLPPDQANPSSSTGSLEYNDELMHSCWSPKSMDNKDNLSTIEEDGLDMATFSKLRTVKKSRKKVGRCNLRQSLAWNQAFFSEEGVLDPIELSILSGSSIKSKENIISMVNGQMSPLLGLHKSGGASSVNSVEQKIFGKMHGQSGCKNSKILKEGNLLCKLDASIQEDHQELMRIANTNAVDPASKIPKFMPTKSPASSLQATSRDDIPSLKKFTFDKSTTTANIRQNTDTKCFPSNMRKLPSCGQSLKSSRSLVPMDKDTRGFNSTSDSSVSKVVQGTTIPCSSVKGSSSITKKAHHGKLPPRVSQPQRNCHPPRPTVPLIRATSVAQADDSRLLPPSTGKKITKGPPAPKSFGGTILSNNMENSLSSGNVVHSSKNISMMPLDVMNTGVSGGSDSQKSAEEALKKQPLVVHSNAGNMPQVLSPQKPESNINKEVPHASNSMLQMDNMSLVRGSRSIKDSPQVNVSMDVLHSCLPTRKKCANTLEPSNNSSQSCSLGKQIETEIAEGTLEVNNQVKQPLPEYTGLSNSPVSGKSANDGRPAGNYLFPNVEFSLSDREADSSLPIKSSLTLTKEQETFPAFISNLEVGCALAQETGIENGFRINDLTSVSSEKIKSLLRSSKEQRSRFCAISNSEKDDSLSQRTFEPAEKAHLRSNDLAVRLNSSSEDPQPTIDSKVHDSTLQFGNKDLINSKGEGSLLNCSKDEQKDKVKQDIGQVKHQLNAAPFSEEWLAAIEVFGEEILELKTGSVQNSPPDKTLPEPSPWSPVKRKAQDIGPFDCTKHSTNLSASNSS
ncbi:hypothetical protein Cni_G15056 [Canna indica]|uniref:Uncharacterized protein n=1 Tax=Canna indica TaxID=4628 RepID=A0AAQ3KCR6_9LILI|nr:hypothetical protein Cni_G15056 [Canna indica]